MQWRKQTAELRLAMQKLCNLNVRVFRTEKTLKEGVDEIKKHMTEWNQYQLKINH